MGQRDQEHIEASCQVVDNADRTLEAAEDDRERKEECVISGEWIHTVALDPAGVGVGKAGGR